MGKVISVRLKIPDSGLGCRVKNADSNGGIAPLCKGGVIIGKRRYEQRWRSSWCRGKKKPLADKIAEGNLGGRKLTVMEFSDTADLEGQEMPEPNKMLEAIQKDGKALVAGGVYKATWQWLDKRGCAALVSPQL